MTRVFIVNIPSTHTPKLSEMPTNEQQVGVKTSKAVKKFIAVQTSIFSCEFIRVYLLDSLNLMKEKRFDQIK